MEDIGHSVVNILGTIVFVGFWCLFLYFIFHFLAESDDKKRLKYLEAKSGENKIENDKPMEDKEEKTTSTEKRWYAPYIVGGLIYSVGSKIFGGTLGGDLALVVFSIGAMFFYYPLKSRIMVKNEVVRVMITFFILEIIVASLVGSSAGLISGLISRSGGQQLVKKSSTGICHAEGSTYYSRTKKFTPYSSIDDCLNSGGRLPKG